MVNQTQIPVETDSPAFMEENGYALVRGLFSVGEIEAMNTRFGRIHAEGVPGKYEPTPVDQAGDDPLLAYPRVMNPHRFDDEVLRWMCDARLADYMTRYMGEAPLGAQSMFYFKPPGARGQTMHQDNFYLQIQPGTCMAAWIAMERCDPRNGCMMVAPGSHRLPIDCSNLGEKGSYDGGRGIRVPKEHKPVFAEMEAGDVLFFNGSLIHGSGRNVSTDRFRRSLIFHYAGESSCERISRFYFPLVNMQGNVVSRDVTTDGGPCGGFVGDAH